MKMWKSLLIIWTLIQIFGDRAKVFGDDTPENGCPCSLIEGQWVFNMGPGGKDKNTANCWSGVNSNDPPISTVTFTLQCPDVATDKSGNIGFWTSIDGGAVEIVANGKEFHFHLIDSIKKPISDCAHAFWGSSHNIDGTDWACFDGSKASSGTSRSRWQRSITSYADFLEALRKSMGEKQKSKNKESDFSAIDSFLKERLGDTASDDNRLFKTDPGMIAKINRIQTSWKAVEYERYNTMTVDQMRRMSGGRSVSHRAGIKEAKMEPLTREVQQMLDNLPNCFDWRNVSGVNYVSPVRNQEFCGSCYAFATTAMLESRFSIATQTAQQPIFSTQDIVDCCPYTWKCDGGTGYEALMYSEDYGFVEESCYPYIAGETGSCNTPSSCERYYSTDYQYVGGYYGASNEANMMLALVNNGPLAVAILTKKDLMFYSTGIYYHTGIGSTGPPTDHEVLLVGYGVDDNHGKYWIIKNSWGADWGKDGGFFRLRRGSNECAVESSAVESFPVLNNK